MRGLGSVLPAGAACLLAAAAGLVAIPAGIATAHPTSPPTKAAETKASPPSTSAPRKVWTAADREKLRTSPSQSVTFLEGQASPEPRLLEGVVVAGPQGVPARLQEMANEAQANISRLERERLAASNPLLRGLAAGQPIRPVADIDKDRLKWSERLRLAETALANAGP